MLHSVKGSYLFLSYLSALQQSIMDIGSLAKAVPDQAFSYLRAKLGATVMQWK